MSSLLFLRRSDRLNADEALYWQDILYRTVKIGVEIEFALPKGLRKTSFMPGLVDALAPTRDLKVFGRHGVLDVVSEHCGVEIQVIGRQPFFPALRTQFSRILSLLPEGIRARATCGQHYHVLTPGLSEPVPGIILANLWNLTRRYAPELRYLTSCGETRESMCRRRTHCSHLEMVRLSPGILSLPDIVRRLRSSQRVPEHQNFLNLEHVVFTEAENIQDLHYENRFPDADLCPTTIAAKSLLFLAMLLKSVELAQYGVLHVGRIVEWRRKIELLDMLSNNEGKLATSDTSDVSGAVIKELQVGSREFLDVLSGVFRKIGRISEELCHPHPAFAVLCRMAETPVSCLRSVGLGWRDCEKVFTPGCESRFRHIDDIDRRLFRMIDLGELMDEPDLASWQSRAAEQLLLTEDETKERLGRLGTWRELSWDDEHGTLMFGS